MLRFGGLMRRNATSLRTVYSDVPTVWTTTELETDDNRIFKQMNVVIISRFITKSLTTLKSL